MEREVKGTLLMLVIVATVVVAVTFTAVTVLGWQNIMTGNVVSDDNGQTQPETSNIKSAEPTPYSCTPTQNCGSPTCAAARGGGSCGCGR